MAANSTHHHHKAATEVDRLQDTAVSKAARLLPDGIKHESFRAVQTC